MFIEIEKRSKKAQKEYYKEKRSTWGLVKPYNKVVESAKKYKRVKRVECIDN